jgi:hypothetical protein
MTNVRLILALFCVLALRTQVDAQTGRTVSYTEASSTLVMPFDLTGGKQSFALVSKVGVDLGTPLRTHWIYYSADCRHLADLDVTLTDNDTTIVDPSHLQAESQAAGAKVNQKTGPIGDLTGERGAVFVSTTVGTPQLAGAWTIADPASGASFAYDAIGITEAGDIDPPFRHDAAVSVQTFNPQSLTGSEMIIIGVQDFSAGFAPIDRSVCCDIRFVDAVEASISLPDFCFDCVGFAAISADLADADTPSLLPATSSIASAGLLQFEACRAVNPNSSETPLDIDQALFVFHGQEVGPFGVVLNARYTGRRPPG